MIKIKEIKKLDDKVINKTIEIFDNEIHDSILSKLNYNLKYEYLKKFILENNIYFYVCLFEDQIVGSALLGNTPNDYFTKFSNLKYKIILNLIFSFKFITLLNISLAFLQIDIFHLKRENKIIINNNLNLTLVAIDKNFQSKGIGKLFLEKILIDFKKKDMNLITLEADNLRSISFYKDKLDFKIIGKKIRLFKNQTILIKNF